MVSGLLNSDSITKVMGNNFLIHLLGNCNSKIEEQDLPNREQDGIG